MFVYGFIIAILLIALMLMYVFFAMQVKVLLCMLSTFMSKDEISKAYKDAVEKYLHECMR